MQQLLLKKEKKRKPLCSLLHSVIGCILYMFVVLFILLPSTPLAAFLQGNSSCVSLFVQQEGNCDWAFPLPTTSTVFPILI